MNRYKRIIEDTADDREIIDTKHAIERYVERYSSIYTKEQVKAVIRKVMDVILTKYKDKECEYAWHSKSTMMGGIIIWTRYGDARKDTGKNNAVIKTLFPPKAIHHANNVCAQIIVESHIMYALRKKGHNWRRTKPIYGFGENYTFEEDKNYKFPQSFIVLFEDKIYETSIDEYIVIE
jgi:hypothetical protein